MTTRELIARLQELDPTGELLVTERRYSDHGPMEADSWTIQVLYPQNRGAWFTADDYRLSFKQHVETQPVRTVHFAGN